MLTIPPIELQSSLDRKYVEITYITGLSYLLLKRINPKGLDPKQDPKTVLVLCSLCVICYHYFF